MDRTMFSNPRKFFEKIQNHLDTRMPEIEAKRLEKEAQEAEQPDHPETEEKADPNNPFV